MIYYNTNDDAINLVGFTVVHNLPDAKFITQKNEIGKFNALFEVKSDVMFSELSNQEIGFTTNHLVTDSFVNIYKTKGELL
jgi:hypothetical protein